MHPRPRVAVCLVNYKDYGDKYFPACYASLREQTYPAELFTVFVIQNGVAEESQRFTEQVAPQARFLQNASNLGWTGGNNAAIRVALEEGFDYVVLLNMDTVVDKDWLRELVAAAQAQPDVQILQSKILLYGTHRVNSLGNKIQYLGYGYCHGYGLPDTTSNGPVALDYASGAAMLVKREVFERIGLLREDYFMYYDDLEFCWRARLAGCNVGLAEQSICHHRYDVRNILGLLYYVQRNRLLTLLTLEKRRTLVLILPCLLVAEVILGVYFLTRGWGATQWKLLRYFATPKTWQAIAARRREVNRLRTRRDAEIVKHFTGRVVFAEISNPALRYLFNPLLALYWSLVRRLIVW